jgi:hypothetical protein
MYHCEAVEPIVVEYNVTVREYTMTQLMGYFHLDLSSAIKTKHGEQFGVRQTVTQVTRSHSAVTFHPSEKVR